MLGQVAVLIKQRLDLVLAEIKREHRAHNRAIALARCVKVVKQADHVGFVLHLAEAGKRDIVIGQHHGRVLLLLSRPHSRILSRHGRCVRVRLRGCAHARQDLA